MADTREIRITTEVPNVKFVCISLVAHEHVSRPFVIELELLNPDFTLTLKDFLGKHMTAEVDASDSKVRYFDGIITRFSYVNERLGLACYRATLRPWLWLLTRKVQSKVRYVQPDQSGADSGSETTAGTLPNLVKSLFEDGSYADVEWKLSNTNYRVVEYCVQYQESDFAFVSRVLEQEGIYYFFKHESGKHTLVLTDSMDKLATFDDSLATISYTNRSAGGQRGDFIDEWTIAQEVQSGKVTVRDYDFTAPNANLEKSKTMPKGYTPDDLEIYEYPGKYKQPNEGETYANAHLEAEITRFELAEARSNARWLVPGYLFTLADAARDDQDRQYLVLEAKSSMRVEFDKQEKQDFSAEIVALPQSVTYRPRRVTPRPYIRGPQTALVVGPSGQEIYTDKFARVKVQFYWDRDGSKDENSSCWVRCAQAWAGKSWGFVFIPRINQEVIVHFMEGDPDHPIITGAVYNGPEDNPSPITLPDEATKSTIKSNSSPNGGGFNQIRLEDKAGSEELFIHAHKDMNTEVETGDQTNTVKQGNRTVTVTQGKETTTISQDCALTVQQGNHTIDVSAGTSALTAAQSITLKVGDNKIVIDTSGVTITATNITLNANAAAKMTGATLDLEGSGTTTLKGGTVAIN
jgi:type VI secretion system secreted protein VgrG